MYSFYNFLLLPGGQVAECVRKYPDGGEGDGNGAVSRPNRRFHLQEDAADCLLQVVRSARLRRHLVTLVQVPLPENMTLILQYENFENMTIQKLCFSKCQISLNQILPFRSCWR